MSVRPAFALVIVGALLVLGVGIGGAFLLAGAAPSSTGQFRPISQSTATPRATNLQTPLSGALSQAPIAEPTLLPTLEIATPATLTTIPTSTQSPTPTHTPTPRPTPVPERTGGPVAVPNLHKGVRWVTLQAGHYLNNALPEELKHLTEHTGASAAGVNEVDVNVAIARLTAQMLYERGYSVDLLGTTVPPNYTTDLFLALHADGNVDTSLRGFKAVAPWGSAPASDIFVGYLYEEYGKATGLPSDPKTSAAMANYYAFNPIVYHHAVNPQAPSALLEMGFVTNSLDREALTREEDHIAWGIANAVDRYFHSGVAGPTPSPYPTFTPSHTATPTKTSSATTSPTPTVTAEYSATPGAPQPVQRLMLTRTANERLRTPPPAATPMTGTITADGRWLPPVAPNGRKLPPPGSDAPPVLLGEADDDPGPDRTAIAPGWQPHIWQQYYVPQLGRSIWTIGPVLVKTPTTTPTSTPSPASP